MKNFLPVTVIVALVVGAGAFFGGMKYQQTQTPARSGLFGRDGGPRLGGGMGSQGRFAGGGGRVTGEIISMDDKSITVKLEDGSSKIVLLPESVTVGKMDLGSKSDLKVGGRVGVFGASNSDGSVTAANVQLNPQVRPGLSPTASDIKK